ITAIHLRSGAIGNAGTLDQCKIELNDGSTITVTNAKANGLPDDAQTPAYRNFVADLHGRLAAAPNLAIRFSAGVSQARYRFGVGILIVAALFFVVTPVGLAMYTGDLSALGYAAGGCFLCFPLFKMIKTNSPREYTADRLPDELLS